MTTRNNMDRLGAKGTGGDPPVLPTDNSDSTNKPPDTPPSAQMSFATPTEFADLPSGGKFYPEGHPLHNKDSVEIRYMTAKEEDILSSKTLIRKGVVLDRLLQSVLVDKNINPDDLLIGDKNALIVAVRVTGYGSEYATSVTCPVCSNIADHVFDLENGEINSGDNFGDFDLKKTDDGTFVVKTPASEANVEFRLLIGQDEKSFVKIEANRKKHNLPETSLSDQLRAMIVSVNGNSDPTYIQSFIEHAPAKDSSCVRRAYLQVNPNIDLSQLYDCPGCGFTSLLEVPLSADIFWPK